MKVSMFVVFYCVLLLCVTAVPQGNVTAGDGSGNEISNNTGGGEVKSGGGNEPAWMSFFGDEPWIKLCGNTIKHIFQECRTQYNKEENYKKNPWVKCVIKLDLHPVSQNATSSEKKEYHKDAQEKCLPKCIAEERGVVVNGKIDEKRLKEFLKRILNDSGIIAYDNCMKTETNATANISPECSEFVKSHKCISGARQMFPKPHPWRMLLETCSQKLNLNVPNKNSTDPKDMRTFWKEANSKCITKCFSELQDMLTNDGKVNVEKVKSILKPLVGDDGIEYYEQCMKKEIQDKSDCMEFNKSHRCVILSEVKFVVSKVKPCVEEKCKAITSTP